jgi:hypothetical protein
MSPQQQLDYIADQINKRKAESQQEQKAILNRIAERNEETKKKANIDGLKSQQLEKVIAKIRAAM